MTTCRKSPSEPEPEGPISIKAEYVTLVHCATLAEPSTVTILADGITLARYEYPFPPYVILIRDNEEK